MTTVTLVTSPKPRPKTQSGRYFMKTGAAAWGRDPHHILGENKHTLCGIDASEWLTIGDRPLEVALADDDLCTRCDSRIRKQNS